LASSAFLVGDSKEWRGKVTYAQNYLDIQESIKKLKSEDPDERKRAVEDLSGLGKIVLPDLFAAIRKPGIKYDRNEYLEEKIRESRTGNDIPYVLHYKFEAASALGERKDEAAAEEPGIEAIEIFVRIGPPAVPDLIKALDDRHLFCPAAEALGKIKDKRAVVPLIKQLTAPEIAHCPNISSRAEAAMALGEIGDIRAIGPILRAKIEKVPDSFSIVQALVKFKSDSIPVFIRYLSDKDPKVRLNVIATLAEIGDRRAIPPLGKIAKEDPDPETRSWAKEVIQKIERRS